MQHHELIKKAAALARHAPAQWADFVTAFAGYAEHHRDQILSSPLDALQVNQGRAQSLKTVTDIFKKAVEDAEKMERK